jgi:transposase InsO family protein
LAFLEQVLEEMPFPVQCIQNDRGQEFFAYKVQEQLQAWRIKFRPIRPRSPHLNGKGRARPAHRLEEFWVTGDLEAHSIGDELAEWQTLFNWQRPHASLGYRAPAPEVFVPAFAARPRPASPAVAARPFIH